MAPPPAPRSSRRAVGVAVVVLAALLVVGLVALVLRPGPDSGADPGSAARTTFADLTPAGGDPTLPGLGDLHPARGAVVQAAGPFDDRFDLSALRFDGTQVTGRVEITSDVSDLLELQVQAGFYDGAGRLLGTADDSYHADEDAAGRAGPPAETHPFSVGVPGPLRGEAVAAAVGVTVLVNE